jgi:hypothetical protein
MAFVQIMEASTSNYDAITQLESEWLAATEGKRTLRRSVVARDRTDGNHYVILAFFDSYESAMENSNLAETKEFAAQVEKLADGPIKFSDFDVVEDRSS